MRNDHGARGPGATGGQPRWRGPARRLGGAVAVLVGLLAGCGQSGSGAGDVPAKDVATASPTGAATGPAAATSGAPSSSSAPSTAASAPGGTTAEPAAGGVAASPASAGPSGPRPAASTADPVASAAPSASASSTASAAASAAASATAEPALTVQSPKTQEAAFSVWMQSAKSYKVGQAGSVEVVLVPKGEYHCNEAYPYKVKLGAAPAGLSFSADVVRGATVSASRASIRVPFTATAVGDARISGKFYFSVCTADQCVIDSREVAATVKVE